jgi:periplasmic protein TonB
MYGATRTRAPASTPAVNKMVGIGMAGLMTLAAGYGLTSGLSRDFIAALTGPTTIITLPEDLTPPPEKTPDLRTTVDAPEAPPLVPIDLPDFPYPTDPPFVVERKDPPPLPPPGDGVAPPPRAPVKQMPKLLEGPKPEYPSAAIRADWEGMTGISVCVDARGRVTSQSLASSSGHSVLDEAALKWIRGARFKPGTLDGSAQAMCGASVIYEWKLNRR